MDARVNPAHDTQVFASPLFRVSCNARNALLILLRQVVRVGAKEISKPQPPHQQYRSSHAAWLKTLVRRDGALAQTKRPARALEAFAQRDILQQRNFGKSSGCLERLARD